jgi:hypothetical protein
LENKECKMFKNKSIIFNALAVSIIALCCVEVAYIYKKVANEQEVQQALKEKRHKLDKNYLLDLEIAWGQALNQSYSSEARSFGFEDLEEIKKQMHQDGYDGREIYEFSRLARQTAKKELTEERSCK